MAYVVLFYKDQETGRRGLDGPVVIGRSPECNLTIRDVLLSRRHCRIEKEGRDWVLSDLGSKNGTRIGGNVVTRHVLHDRDVIRMGNSTVRFFRGAFVPSTKPAPKPSQRPADPFEALSGTVTDFKFEPRGPVRSVERLPKPKPGPLEPDAYTRDGVRSLVKGLASSSWDSIYDSASRPDPVVPQSPMVQDLRRHRPRQPHVDLALQVRPDLADHRPGSSRGQAPRSGVLDPPRPSRWRLLSLPRRLAMLFHWLAFVLPFRHS